MYPVIKQLFLHTIHENLILVYLKSQRVTLDTLVYTTINPEAYLWEKHEVLNYFNTFYSTINEWIINKENSKITKIIDFGKMNNPTLITNS